MDVFATSSMRELHIGSSNARYSLNFFGDVLASMSSAAGTYPSFGLGAQDILITGQLEDHFVATTELAISFEDATNEPIVDMERLQVAWLDKTFFVRAGRFHTTLGYWNNAYHHGRWLQPSIMRPRWVAFEDEGGILPVHAIGLDGGFNLDVGVGTTLRFTATLANGRGKIVDDVRNNFDYRAGKLVGGQLELIGGGSTEMKFGLSGMYDRIPAQPATDRPALPDRAIDETILGAYFAVPGDPVVLITEAYLVRHAAAGAVSSTYGGFALAGYHVQRFTPYLRGEVFRTDGPVDPFFVPDRSVPNTLWMNEIGGLAGLRFDLTAWTSLRAEYRFTHPDGKDDIHEGVVQWSWGF